MGCHRLLGGCFYVLAIVSSAVMNTGVPVSLSILVSSVCMLSSGIVGSYGKVYWGMGEEFALDLSSCLGFHYDNII